METTNQIIKKTKKEAQKRTAYSLFGTIILGGFTFFNFKYWIIPVLKNYSEKGKTLLTVKENFEGFCAIIVGYILIFWLAITFVKITKEVINMKKIGLISLFILLFIISLTLGFALKLIFSVIFFMPIMLVVGIIIGLFIEFIGN